MKYIDADQLKTEIGRLRDEYTDIAINSHYGTVNANHVVDDLEQLLSFLDTLTEQPVECLEKAAMEYAEKHGFRVPYDGSNNFYDDVDVKASKEGFIAGAEWQKNQMLNT